MFATRDASRWGVLSVGLAMLIALIATVGCESDEFAGAPSAEAPDESTAEAQRPRRPQPKQRRQARQQRPQARAGSAGSIDEDESMPADHPPIGGAQGARDGRRPSGSGSGPSPSPSGGSANLPVDWEAPETWKSVEPSSSMRKAQYRLPGADDAAPATLAVFYFGAQGGGSVQANIDRWVGQFEPQDGTSAKEAAEITETSVDGMNVHLVDVTGTFNAGRGMGSGGAKENYRMLAAIAETDRGSVFFKIVGPAPTVTDHESEFRTFVDSFESTS